MSYGLSKMIYATTNCQLLYIIIIIYYYINVLTICFLRCPELDFCGMLVKCVWENSIRKSSNFEKNSQKKLDFVGVYDIKDSSTY